MAELSKISREIISLLAKGLTTDEVATKLKIARRTAETYRHRILKQTGSRNTAELIVYGYNNGILLPKSIGLLKRMYDAQMEMNVNGTDGQAHDQLLKEVKQHLQQYGA